MSREASRPGIHQVEVPQEQEGSADWKLPGGSLAERELSGEDGGVGTGIRPCGDWDEKDDIVNLNS